MYRPEQNIPIKTPADLEKMREAGSLLAEVFEEIGPLVVPGATTADIDTAARSAIEERGGIPAFLNLYGFPASVCASVNEELVHGIPSPERVLAEGDIVSIDMGLLKRGWYSDRAFTFAVGEISDDARRLIDVTEASFWAGAASIAPGVKLGVAQYAIQRTVETAGMHIVEKYVGHGIGQKLHEPPQVPNHGRPTDGPRLRRGMALAIEPMVGISTGETVELEDGWTVIMHDRTLSAHYEHTIALVDDGVEILTCPPDEAAEKLERARKRLAEMV